MLSGGSILLHDNVRPHTVKLVRDKLQRFGWETLQHPPYSPYLSPCDFHIFGDLKIEIRGRRFHSDEEMQEWVNCGSEESRPTEVIADSWQYREGGGLWLGKRYPSTLISVLLTEFRYFSYQLATQLHSRGWVNTSPDPILLEKFRRYRFRFLVGMRVTVA